MAEGYKAAKLNVCCETIKDLDDMWKTNDIILVTLDLYKEKRVDNFNL